MRVDVKSQPQKNRLNTRNQAGKSCQIYDHLLHRTRKNKEEQGRTRKNKEEQAYV